MEFKGDRDLLDMLRERCQGDGAARAFAREAGVSETLISLILAEKRSIGPKVAKALGYRKFIRWVSLQAV